MAKKDTFLLEKTALPPHVKRNYTLISPGELISKEIPDLPGSIPK